MQVPELKALMEPLAKYLAELSFHDPVHSTLIADLYDMVNEIRDTKIAGIQDLIIRLKNDPECFSLREKKSMVLNLEGRIRALQGAV